MPFLFTVDVLPFLSTVEVLDACVNQCQDWSGKECSRGTDVLTFLIQFARLRDQSTTHFIRNTIALLWSDLTNKTAQDNGHHLKFFPSWWYYLDKKKKPCHGCIKSESCDIEKSRCLIQLRLRERTRLVTAATSRIDASWHRGEIRLQILWYHMMDHKDGSFFGQGSSWETSYSQPFVPTWSAMLHVPQGNAAGQWYHLFSGQMW